MQPLQYLQTTQGIIWIVISVVLGFVLTWLGYLIINKVPAAWLCDYNETPSPELLSGKRVNYKRSGIVLSVVSAICFGAIRLQFNKGYDIYFILLILISFVALMITVCDFKYTIIPDQFTIALGVLGIVLSVYDLVRGYHILHNAWWSPLVGAVIGAGVMILIDFLGMVIYKKDGMGFGDVKLFGAVGLFTGFSGTIITLILSIITAAICFVVIILISKIKNKNTNTADTESPTEPLAEDSAVSDKTETTESGEPTVAEQETTEIGVSSYLAFGPYIAIAVIAYAALFDVIQQCADAYIHLF